MYTGGRSNLPRHENLFPRLAAAGASGGSARRSHHPAGGRVVRRQHRFRQQDAPTPRWHSGLDFKPLIKLERNDYSWFLTVDIIKGILKTASSTWCRFRVTNTLSMAPGRGAEQARRPGQLSSSLPFLRVASLLCFLIILSTTDVG